MFSQSKGKQSYVQASDNLKLKITAKKNEVIARGTKVLLVLEQNRQMGDSALVKVLRKGDQTDPEVREQLFQAVQAQELDHHKRYVTAFNARNDAERELKKLEHELSTLQPYVKQEVNIAAQMKVEGTF